MQEMKHPASGHADAVVEVTEDAPEGSSAAEAAAQDPPPPVRSGLRSVR